VLSSPVKPVPCGRAGIVPWVTGRNAPTAPNVVPIAAAIAVVTGASGPLHSN
jgi:hypothetical protein